MNIQKISPRFVVNVFAILLQLSTIYGKALEGMDSTTEILTPKKRPRLPSKKPKWCSGGDCIPQQSSMTFQEFLYVCAILLGLLLLYGIYKLRPWRYCRDCCCEEEEEGNEEHVTSTSFAFSTVDETTAPQQQWPNVGDYDSFDIDLPLEYPIQEYNSEINPSFSKIRNSTKESVC